MQRLESADHEYPNREYPEIAEAPARRRNASTGSRTGREAARRDERRTARRRRRVASLHGRPRGSSRIYIYISSCARVTSHTNWYSPYSHSARHCCCCCWCCWILECELTRDLGARGATGSLRRHAKRRFLFSSFRASPQMQSWERTKIGKIPEKSSEW